MRGAVLYAPGDIRVEDRDDPKLIEPTDAILQLSATCVCGSDLWPYRGVEPVDGPSPMGHEYAGIVQEVGSEVTTIKPGQFVVGSFWPPTTPAPSARPATRARVSSGCSWAPSARKQSWLASPWPTAPWSPPRSFLRTT